MTVGQTVEVPRPLGEWTTDIVPIPVDKSLQPLLGDDYPGTIGLVSALMAAGDHIPDGVRDVGHAAFNEAVTNAINDLIPTANASHPFIADDDITSKVQGVSEKVRAAITSALSLADKVIIGLSIVFEVGSSPIDYPIGNDIWRFNQDEFGDSAWHDYPQKWTTSDYSRFRFDVSARMATVQHKLTTANPVALLTTPGNWNPIGFWVYVLTGQAIWDPSENVALVAASPLSSILYNWAPFRQAPFGWIQEESGIGTLASPSATAIGPFVYIAMTDHGGDVTLTKASWSQDSLDGFRGDSKAMWRPRSPLRGTMSCCSPRERTSEFITTGPPLPRLLEVGQRWKAPAARMSRQLPQQSARMFSWL
jgi:hypothetical protein